ncbi:uncharacterized protein LOC135389914 [Ornithodoros turicata]|uniref:uncharacterized protein LOC135389914 n=1 Tax=Ornithodoros turicata TaxID=34597 RepID=UPI00313A17E3
MPETAARTTSDPSSPLPADLAEPVLDEAPQQFVTDNGNRGSRRTTVPPCTCVGLGILQLSLAAALVITVLAHLVLKDDEGENTGGADRTGEPISLGDTTETTAETTALTTAEEANDTHVTTETDNRAKEGNEAYSQNS